MPSGRKPLDLPEIAERLAHALNTLRYPYKIDRIWTEPDEYYLKCSSVKGCSDPCPPPISVIDWNIPGFGLKSRHIGVAVWSPPSHPVGHILFPIFTGQSILRIAKEIVHWLKGGEAILSGASPRRRKLFPARPVVSFREDRGADHRKAGTD